MKISVINLSSNTQVVTEILNCYSNATVTEYSDVASYNEAIDILYETLDENADCVFGVSSDNSLDKKYVKVTMISKFCC